MRGLDLILVLTDVDLTFGAPETRTLVDAVLLWLRSAEFKAVLTVRRAAEVFCFFAGAGSSSLE